MTVWVSCHQDWLCATVLEKVCQGMSSTVYLIKPVSHRQSILEVSYSLTPLDAARVTNPILYLFCLSPPSPVSLLVTMSLSNTYLSSSLYFWNVFFFLKLQFIHGARETSSDKTQAKKESSVEFTHISVNPTITQRIFFLHKIPLISRLLWCLCSIWLQAWPTIFLNSCII